MKKLLLLILFTAMFAACYSQKPSKAFVSNFYDAQAFMYEDNFEEALKMWRLAEDKDPNNPNVWYNIGVCCKNTSKDREMSELYLRKALDYVNPKYKRGEHKERTAPIDCYYHLGSVLRMLGKYDESTEMLTKAKKLAQENGRDKLVELIDEEMEITVNAKNISTRKSCLKMEVENIGDVVNSEYSDHSPIISCDGRTLYFTSKRPNSLGSEGYENIYVTTKDDDGKWRAPEMLPVGINTKGSNESVVALSPDGKELYFFRSGTSLQGNLYVVEKGRNGSWGKPSNLSATINTKYRESHVTISPDGGSMYFTSDRPGGFGGLDIYVMKKLPNGQWSEPKVLPAEVNTPRDEEYPFVHPNGSVLYFNSKGHESVGGYDVFFSRINEDGTFSPAENMCSPINTPDNDICYSLSCDGKTAYVAGVRADSYGEYDLYVIQDKTEESNMIVYRGSVKYADNAIPKGVLVWVKNNTNGADLGSYKLDSLGNYTCYLLPSNDYSLTYSKNGEKLSDMQKTPADEEVTNFRESGNPVQLDDVILPLLIHDASITLYGNNELTADAISVLNKVRKTADELNEESRVLCINFEFDENQIAANSPQMKRVVDYLSKSVKPTDMSYNERPMERNLYNVTVLYEPELIVDNPVEQIMDTVEIGNVYFDFDKYNIKSEYEEILNKLAAFMTDNPGAKIEVGGHCDYTGTDEYNYLLSGRRAMAVKDYLVAKGVKQDKVEVVKYGESKPIANNNRSSLRKYNRRVDFRVLIQGSEAYLKIAEANIVDDGKPDNIGKAANTANKAKVYRVQVFALVTPKPVNSFGIPNLKVREINGIYKYYIGNFSTYDEAKQVLDNLDEQYRSSAIILESWY